MPLAPYGATNPAAVDPWPIETNLAELAVAGNKTQAQGLLDVYQRQREAQTNAYNQDLDAQHAFDYKQLAQQLYETRLKAAPELLGKPYGALLLGSGGIPGMDLGTDPSVMQSVIGGNLQAQRAQDYSHAATGLAQATAAGFQPTTQQASDITGGLAGPQGTPVAIDVAKLRLQGDLARAAAAAGSAGPSRSIKINGPHGEENWTFSGKIPGSVVDQTLDQAGVPRVNSGSPNSTSLPPNAAALAPGGANAPQRPGTQAAPTQPGGQGKTIAPKNEDGRTAAIQQQVLAKLPGYAVNNKAEAADIRAGMAKNNGMPIIQWDAQGKPHLYGAKGIPYN